MPKYIYKKVLLICAVKKYSIHIWSLFNATHPLPYHAHILFIHCHFGSFTISEKISRLM